MKTWVRLLLTAVRNAVQLDDSANGSHCCIAVSTLNTFILLTAACRPATIGREGITWFLWQQWLRERATTWRYTWLPVLFCHCRSCAVLLWRGDRQWITRRMLVFGRSLVRILSRTHIARQSQDNTSLGRDPAFPRWSLIVQLNAAL
jgi:hypothetical protein